MPKYIYISMTTFWTSVPAAAALAATGSSFATVVTANYMHPKVSQPPTKNNRRKSRARTTRQFVPFEEMQRLMLTYGPIATPRKSKHCPNECGTAGNAKTHSISFQRKIYRWFPDFESRFVSILIG
jgi:hypothetical protein